MMFLLAGCGPHDLKSCLADASTRPTNLGVQLAMGQCTKNFPPPPNPYEQIRPPAATPVPQQSPSQIDQFLGLPEPRSAGMPFEFDASTARPDDGGGFDPRTAVEVPETSITDRVKGVGDFLGEQMPTALVILACVAALGALAKAPIRARIGLLRVVRGLCGMVLVWQLLTLLPALTWIQSSEGVTGQIWAQLVLKVFVFFSAGLLFLGLRRLINRMHSRRYGVVHPSLGWSKWKL